MSNLDRRLARHDRLTGIVGGIFLFAVACLAVTLSGASLALFGNLFGFGGLATIGTDLAVAAIAAAIAACALAVATLVVSLLTWAR